MTSYTHVCTTRTIDQAQLTDDARAIVQAIGKGLHYGAWLLALPVLTHVAIVQWVITSAYQSAMAGYRVPRRIPINHVPDTNDIILVYHGQDDTLDLPLSSAIPQLATSLPCNLDGYPVDDMMWSQYGLTPYALPATRPVRKADHVVTMAANDVVDPAPSQPRKTPRATTSRSGKPSMSWTKQQLLDYCTANGIKGVRPGKDTKASLLDWIAQH
jgi:hypothetical protein